MTDLFLTVLNMSLTAGYVILFIILIRLLLKKAPKVISYVLWSVAAFRLLCPFSFKSILSLIPMNASPIPKDIAYRQIPHINSGITAIDTYVNSSLPAPAPQASANPLQIYIQIGTYIWLFGIFVMLIYSIVSVLILKKHLKSSCNIEQNIYESDCLKTPFVLGLFRPRIFIPAGLTAEEKSYVIRHEQTHIRRFDHIIKPFAFMVLSIHWFNPLVWAAFILMGTDMELSCDERVVRELGFDIKKSYSMSLLSLAADRRILNGSPLAFGEGNVKSRIKNVLNYKKPAFWVVIIAVIAVIITGIGLLFNPSGNSSNTSSMRWAKSLKANDIQSIELIVQPSNEQERYKKYEPGEFAEIVKLAHQSRGKVVKNIKKINGSNQTFYITTKDGIIHRFLNEGNEYLVIDNDTFDAGYEWLSKWNYQGDSTAPDELSERLQTVPVSGGSKQTLTLNAAQTTPLEPAAAEWSRDQNMGADMAFLDYASDDVVIFHGYFGLFVYNLASKKLIRSLNLLAIGCEATQGEHYCGVTVSADGNTVQLHPANSDMMYIYTVSDNTLKETGHQPMEDPFDGFVPITDVMEFDKIGNCSFNAVQFDNDQFGYLQASDWTLGSLTYVRADQIYKLFDENTNISYTEEEIEAAKECVRKYFTGEAPSRALNDLWYDEEECAKIRASYMESGKGNTNGVSAGNIIVLLCNFTIENDNTFQGDYPNWHFVLIRDSADGAWRIDGQGV